MSDSSLCCSVTKSCLTLCDPLDWSLPGSSDHVISQAKIREWVAISLSRTLISCLLQFFDSEPRIRTICSCSRQPLPLPKEWQKAWESWPPLPLMEIREWKRSSPPRPPPASSYFLWLSLLFVTPSALKQCPSSLWASICYIYSSLTSW